MIRVPTSEFDEPVEYQKRQESQGKIIFCMACFLLNFTHFSSSKNENTVFSTPQLPGLYKTHITNEGTPILSSPFDTLIEP